VKKRTPRCSGCDAVLRGARCVIGGRWFCHDCTYEADYGTAKRAKRPGASTRPQDETLFDPGPRERKPRR
jgi:hypothetical protein